MPLHLDQSAGKNWTMGIAANVHSLNFFHCSASTYRHPTPQQAQHNPRSGEVDVGVSGHPPAKHYLHSALRMRFNFPLMTYNTSRLTCTSEVQLLHWNKTLTEQLGLPWTLAWAIIFDSFLSPLTTGGSLKNFTSFPKNKTEQVGRVVWGTSHGLWQQTNPLWWSTPRG